MTALTQATQLYLHTFQNYQQVFLNWGQKLFFGLLGFQIIWMALWYAFEKESLLAAWVSFLKRFFVTAFFYTLMLHPEWLSSLLASAKIMGQELVHAPLDLRSG